MSRVSSVAEKLAEWEAERDLREARPVAVYVSTPITTGTLYLSWWRRIGSRLQPGSPESDESQRAHVILPNVQRTARFLELLRWRHVGVIIDPTSLDVPGWTQDEYNAFWATVLERHVKRVILLSGWEFSRGCVREFETAQRLGIDCVDEALEPLTRVAGLALIDSALSAARTAGIDVAVIAAVRERLSIPKTAAAGVAARELYKDEVLDHLARTANVAQFVSFTPGQPKQRYSRVRDVPPNAGLGTIETACATLLRNAPEGVVNIRSFDPRRPEGNPFLKRLGSVADVVAAVRSLASSGLHTIVNEAIAETDGGVSGVTYRGVLEFAPDATPRCVDDIDVDTCELPFELGMGVLRSVYGFEPDLRGRDGARVEFSVHPSPRGWRSDHTILWQLEQRPAPAVNAQVRWPHRFSRLIGDKAFGLALAAAAGLPVPRTIVYSRRLFPFSFGMPTGSGEVWTRTCPEVKAPGLYPSTLGWWDPFSALKDPSLIGHFHPPIAGPFPPLASVIIQENVPPHYSGTVTTNTNGSVQIEGVPGAGDAFMIGDAKGEDLPTEVRQRVSELHARVHEQFGPNLVEWVFDGSRVWIVQLTVSKLRRAMISAEETTGWEDFRFQKGALEDFRQAVLRLRGTGTGLRVIGNVSPLSHAGEIAEQYGVPVEFVRPEP